MEKETNPYDLLLTCMEQKLLQMTKISDLTKQIEVRCAEPEIELDKLLPTRKECMDRIDKCSSLLAATVARLPAEEQPPIRALLRGEPPQNDLPQESERLIPLCAQYMELLRSTIKDDEAARANVVLKRDEAQAGLERLRPGAPGHRALFSVK